MHCEIISILIY